MNTCNHWSIALLVIRRVLLLAFRLLRFASCFLRFALETARSHEKQNVVSGPAGKAIGAAMVKEVVALAALRASKRVGGAV